MSDTEITIPQDVMLDDSRPPQSFPRADLYAQIAAKREDALRDALSRAGVDTLELSTADDLVDVILRFADLRRRRSQLAAGGTVPLHIESLA